MAFEDVYRDLTQTYYYETKYLYNENEVLVDKVNRNGNHRLQEQWWNFKDESVHLNLVVQAGLGGGGEWAVNMAGDKIHKVLGEAE